MQTHKCFSHTSIILKTITSLLVIIFLVGIIQIIIWEVYQEFEHARIQPEKTTIERTDEETRQLEIANAHKEFTPDGTVYLVNYNVTTPGNFKESETIVKDQHNKVLFEGDDKDNPYSFIQWKPKQDKRSRYYHHHTYRQRNLNELQINGGEFSRSYVIPIVNIQNKRIGHWFFDIDKRIFKYYSVKGDHGGFLGANGYTEKKADAVGFADFWQLQNWLRPDSYEPMMIYQTNFAVYEIDFANKQVKTLVKTDNDLISHMALTNWQETGNYDYRPALTVRTESGKCFLHLKNPDQFVEMQLPDNLGKWMNPQFAANETSIFTNYTQLLGCPNPDNRDEYITWIKENQNKPKEYKLLLYEVDKTGNFLERSSFTWTRPARNPYIAYKEGPDTVTSAINSFSSPVPMWITLHWLKAGNFRQWPEWNRATMDFIRAYSAFKMPVNLCFMTVFAVLASLHGWPRRTHIAKLIFWVAFVFLFNLPGFLTYLALNHTPIIHCANCGKKRGLLQNACCRCGTALALPKAKETDLVMPLSA